MSGGWIDLISLGGYPVAIYMASLVVRHWAGKAFRSWRPSHETTAEDCLIRGIFISFLGVLVNSCWWMVYYSLRWLGFADLENAMLAHGFTVNWVTRQIPIILAAYYHMRAYYLYTHVERKNPAGHLILSVIAGWAYVFALLAFDLMGAAP